jgi:hypothetical protein
MERRTALEFVEWSPPIGAARVRVGTDAPSVRRTKAPLFREAAFMPRSVIAFRPCSPYDGPMPHPTATASDSTEAAQSPVEKIAAPPYRVLYDGQCEVCQACVSWLKVLDRNSKTLCLPISAETLASTSARLRIDDCLRQLHVVTLSGLVLVGWDAVAALHSCSLPPGSSAGSASDSRFTT